MSDSELLERLHDEFVWQVNAAVGEDRPDLVQRLVDDYLDQALTLLSAGAQPRCERLDCDVCAARASAQPRRRRHRWRLRRGMRRGTRRG